MGYIFMFKYKNIRLFQAKQIYDKEKATLLHIISGGVPMGRENYAGTVI